MSRIKFSLAVVAAVYLIIVAAMYVLQRQLQYFPTQRNPAPSALGLSDVSVEALATPDGETVVAWYSAATEGLPTILFLHGNGGEIGDRADRFAAYQQAGFGVVFLSWRGYGGSTGSPSEAGLLADARTAFKRLESQGIPPESISIVGESLGTGVAVQLAADKPVGALVLGAPYASAAEIAARQYPWLPVRLLMKDQFRSIDHIGGVTAPTLILHGTDDRVIPIESGRKLYEATTAPTTFQQLDGAGHMALFEATFWAREIEFLRDIYAR